ncbi:TetR/AcrR family transcriptional regulator [Streptomyces capparidis]
MPGQPEAPRRGRPRSEAAERAIIEGVLNLLEEGTSLGELSMERVAKVAGVGKATIYRRWPNKDALVLDAVAVLEDVPLPELSGTSARDDLVALVEWVRRRGVTKRESALLRFVNNEMMRHPALRRRYHETVVEPRRELLRRVVRRGVESGELRGDLDVELMVSLFISPMLVRALLHEWAPLDPGLPDRIVDAVLDGVRKR